jgi:hypothetical protein
MATVFEDVLPKSSVLSFIFRRGAKGLNVTNIRKEKFPVYGQKCLSRKAVYDLAEKFS